MKRQELKVTEKLRVVYGNAASALTLQFNELETRIGKPSEDQKIRLASRLSPPKTDGEKPSKNYRH